jgi:two-component system sensor histidine kinase KdpD
MRQRLFLSPSFIDALLIAAVSAFVATLGALSLQGFFAVYTLSNLYLLAVLASALFGGISGGLLTAFFSFLSYNYYFIPPRFTLLVTDPNDLFALFMFLVTALITGGLAGKIRDHYDEVERRSELIQSIAAFSSRLSGTTTVSDIVGVISAELRTRWGSTHWVLAEQGGHIQPVSSRPEDSVLDQAAREAAQAALVDLKERVLGTQPSGLILPLMLKHGVHHVVVIKDGAPFVDGSEDRRLLDTMLAQAVISMERAAFAQESQRARVAVDEERLRSTLLSSVSHDLRTPLASIIGSASTLRQFNETLEPQTRLELAEAIEDEATRLSRFVDQLLTVTRTEKSLLGAGEWLDPAEILYSAVERARRYFDRHTIILQMAGEAPAIIGHPSLLEQSLFNIIENAAKYAPVGSLITVSLTVEKDAITLAVTDEGPGISLKDQQRIFDKFTRLDPDGPRMGSGLGLTISRNIAHLMQATLTVESPINDGKGSRFMMRFPRPDGTPSDAAKV